MKKPIAGIVGVTLLAGVALGAFAGCGNNNVALEYLYYKSEVDDFGSALEQEYDHDLVYQNDLEVLGADPSAIAITEGDQAGYYYMYNTSDPIGATGYLAYRSKNLNDWECMGVAYNPSLYVKDGITYSAFSTANYWAPEVIYDGELKLYFMFYNAAYMFQGLKFYIDVAVSETPQGPFKQYAQWKYEEGTEEEKAAWAPVEDNDSASRAGLENGKLKIFMPLLDFSKIPEGTKIDESWQTGDAIEAGELPGYMKVIDASPFIDEDGEKYLYFVQDLGGVHNSSAIGVIKMNDDWTPDYTQLKKLTVANRYTVDGDLQNDMAEGVVNEAPFMTRHGNKYYLTFSVNSYTDTAYSVRVAVGDSPMGPFKKLTLDEGGWLLYSEGPWMSGTGHHSFVTVGEETYIVYHAHTDRVLGGGARAIAFDEIVWVENNEGLAVPHCNGPTYSILPLTTGEWKNIAPDATVTSTGMAEGSDVKYLTDRVVNVHNDVDFIHEYEIASGKATITLDFGEYREITGLFIVNGFTSVSLLEDVSVGMIEKVEFAFKDGNVTGTAHTDPLPYDYDRYAPGEEYFVTGGTFALQFKPMLVKSITITLPKVEEELRVLSEIMVLGK